MLSRFELLIVVRNQVRDRALVERSQRLEAEMEALAGAVGADAETWALAGLGADVDVRLTDGNPERRGFVAEELLLTEGAPAEVAAAARMRWHGVPERMTALARGLVVAVARVDGVADARAAECRRLLGVE